MKKYFYLFYEGSVINQIVCAILINWPVFVYGTSVGWMSPMTLLLQSDKSPRGTPFTDAEISWMAAVGYMVCIPSDFLVGFLSDWIGRKKTVLFISAAACVSWVIKLSSLQTWALILARAIFGIIMAGAYVTCPLYNKEISSDSIRGVLGSLVVVFHVSGNLFSYVIGDILSYRTILWVCLALPTIHVVLFMAMPESPSYLVKKGKLEEAARVIGWLHCRSEDDPAVQRILDVIKKEQKTDEETSKFVFKAIVKDKILFRAFRMALVVSLAREVCGSIPVLNFAGDIFANASKGTFLVLTANQQAMMLGGVQLAGCLLTPIIVEWTGRKSLFAVTALVSGLGMIILATWFVLREFSIWTPPWLPIVSLCVCIFCDASGLQPVSVIITGELFSFKYRGSVMATTMSIASLLAFLQALFFKPIATTIGVHVSFYFFAAVCVAAAVYVFLVVPETKQRSVEEIQQRLKTKKEIALEMKEMKSSEEKF